MVEIAKQSIQVGLEQVKPWGFLGDMGQAINDFAKENGNIRRKQDLSAAFFFDTKGAKKTDLARLGHKKRNAEETFALCEARGRLRALHTSRHMPR